MMSSKDFQYCTKRMPRSCVDLVFVYEKQVLLLKRAIAPLIGKWQLPGGSIFLGETIEQCAIRKAKQETGIRITECALRLIGVLTYFLPTRQDICITYKISLTEKPVITLDFQHSEAHWFDELPDAVEVNIKRQLEWALFPSNLKEATG